MAFPMSRKRVTLITGAGGEMGTTLIHLLSERGDTPLLALDLKPLGAELANKCQASLVGDILDQRLLERLQTEYEIETVFHLAALLSTRAEFSPRMAHDVNVQGTMHLFELAVEQSRSHGKTVKFLFPSSIAVYGLPNLETKKSAGSVAESQHNEPRTMYGCNKLYCEQLGRYYSRNYRQLAVDDQPKGVDFRAIRFPGLISAETIPSGGTSDFVPKMIHCAARNTPYACFVRPDTTLPFMAMPDAVSALVDLSDADQSQLSQHTYNIGAFSVSAERVQRKVVETFSQADVRFDIDRRRQAIVDTWPADVDDTPARNEWGYHPHYSFERTFSDYLVPKLKGVWP